jgi:hypothetical protein
MPDWVGSITTNSLQISLNLCKFCGLETCLLICERPIAFFGINRQPISINRKLKRINRKPNRIKRKLNGMNRKPFRVNRKPISINREPNSINRKLTGINRILCFKTPCFGLRHRGLKNTPSHCRFTISLHRQRLCIYCLIRAT